MMKAISTILWIIPYLWITFSEVGSHKQEECVEVGFARASYLNVDQGYRAAKEELTAIWKAEDEKGYPLYRNLSPQLKNVTRAALLLEKTSKNIVALIRKTRVGKRCPEEWLLKGIEKHVTPVINLEKEFAEELGLVMAFRCLVGSPFPNVDGTCINEEGPDFGAVGSKFLRLMPPMSGGEGFGLRPSQNKEKTLPSARQVAELIRRHIKRPAVTSLFTEFSHFMALDSFDIPESPLAEGVDCCKDPDHVDCAPIFLDEKDPLYVSIKCFNYKRSTPAQAILGHRESFSLVSTYFDATPVYGPTNEVAFELKEGYFGYLKYPQSLDEEQKEGKKSKKQRTCFFPKSFIGCFGFDVEETDFIENLKLLLLLEHNFIADSLAEINPHFDDSLLYNEARRYLIAEYNAILFGEFVPMLLGKERAEKHFLLPGSEGPGAKFISEVNPGILTSHALASYRNPSMIDEWRSDWGKTDISSSLHYESIKNDPYQDFLAMDIQRGRDHGVAHYAAWRAFCDNGKNVASWEELESILAKEIVEDLKQLYQDEVGDLDLLIALLEQPEEGAIVGKIFACILVDQYARLKTGNRLFWEHETSMLTYEQRDAIRSQSSAAALLCRHFTVDKIAQNPFLEISESNPEVSCDTISKMNFTAWKDTSLIEVMKKKKQEEEGKREEEAMGKREEEAEAEGKKEEGEVKKNEEGKQREEVKRREEEEGKLKEEEKQRMKDEVRHREEEEEKLKEEEKQRMKDEKRQRKEEKEREEEETKIKKEEAKKKWEEEQEIIKERIIKEEEKRKKREEESKIKKEL